MNQSFWITLAAVAGVLILMAVAGHYENSKRRKQFLASVLRQYGQAPNRSFTYEEFESLTHYWKQHRDDHSFYVDDTTWHDLEMDRIFSLINQTMTSAGEESLYQILRTPVFKKETLDERNSLIEFFGSNEQKRIELQTALSYLGKTSGVSLCDYLDALHDAKRQNVFFHLCLAGLSIISIVLLLIVPIVGICMLVILLFADMYVYIKNQGDMQANIRSLQCVLQLVRTSERIAGLTMPQIADSQSRLHTAARALKSFCRGSYLVMSNGLTTTGPEAMLLDFFKIMFHIDTIKYNSMLRQAQEHWTEIEEMRERIGFLDSMVAAASLRAFLPFYCRGSFTTDQIMDVHDLYHPLVESPVANSIHDARDILLTGSNASGKSTFLKTIAINAILAQTFDTCVASAYQAPFFKVMTSMALSDNLQRKESYYIVEIKSLQRILAEAQKEGMVLCVIDEVLRGTNTIERIAASSQILLHLGRLHACTFAATHDIELSYLLDSSYQNYHFEDEIRDGEISFPYRLKQGRTQTRNAIALLELLGYDKTIVTNARRQAEEFEKNGEWVLCT